MGIDFNNVFAIVGVTVVVLSIVTPHVSSKDIWLGLIVAIVMQLILVHLGMTVFSVVTILAIAVLIYLFIYDPVVEVCGRVLRIVFEAVKAKFK